ncbi:MAG TPA: RlmE family RNA methyltransferase [Myxococcota bacterium]|nr:RlmE family RNA methyltransferase [Myxococcota bacterium]
MSRKKANPYRGDRFTKAAKKQGYAARSVFKLEEIDQRFGLLRRGQKVLDLGCAPGSWSRYVDECGASVVGVDIVETKGIPGVFLLRSVLKVTPERLRDALDGEADVVLSDMAPRTTGDRFGDHVRQVALARRALELCDALLRTGGAFVVKVFDGEDAPAFTDEVRHRFERVKRVKPEATRSRSVEFFLVGTGFSGR